MIDFGQIITDQQLKRLERDLAKEYKRATVEATKKLEKYLEKTERQRQQQFNLYKAGKITRKDYIDWCFRHNMIGKRWREMRDVLALDFHNANQIALAMSKGRMPDIYALNANYCTYQIEHDGRIDTGFTLYNHDAAEYLLSEERQLMPGPSKKKAKEIAANKDLQWNMRKVQSAVLQGILQGESPYEVARRLMRVGEMNYNSAVRYARTMTTNAQNAGRYEAFRRADRLGVDLTIEWQATLDGRTRHEHRMMHGQRRKVGEPFEVEGVKILWPAQPNYDGSTIPQEQIWNCRCTLLSWVKGFEGDTVKSSPKMGNMSFDEWLKAKEIPDTAADRAQFAEYKKLLGKDAPKYYNDFQNLKYNDKKAWESLKEVARMERVIRNAPCKLTKRKFTGYFLKEGAKHAEDFFSVGYRPSDVRLLRYDIARQFNLQNASERAIDQYSSRRFDIFMQLGVTKTRWFVTGWQIDKGSDVPRLLTAFRNEPKK